MKKTKASDRPPIPVPEGFEEIWGDWIEYKKVEKKQSYQSPKTEQKGFNNLYNLSGGDPFIARQIVDQSMANLWEGLHPLKNIQNANGYVANTGGPKNSVAEWAELARKAAQTGTF